MHTIAASRIRLNSEQPSLCVPDGYVGPMTLPGSNGRIVYWTGRVAIGLRNHQPSQSPGGASQSALWIQDLLLAA
jgi:hypothetical protein